MVSCKWGFKKFTLFYGFTIDWRSVCVCARDDGPMCGVSHDHLPSPPSMGTDERRCHMTAVGRAAYFAAQPRRTIFAKQNDKLLHQPVSARLAGPLGRNEAQLSVNDGAVEALAKA